MRSFAIGGVLGAAWIVLSLTAYHHLFQANPESAMRPVQSTAALFSRGGYPAATDGEQMAGSKEDAAAQADLPGNTAGNTGEAGGHETLRRQGVPVHPEGLTVWQGGVAWKSSPDGIRAQAGVADLELEPGALQLLAAVAKRMNADSSLGLIIVSRYSAMEAEAMAGNGTSAAAPDAAESGVQDPGLLRGDALRAELLGLGVMPNRCAVVSQLDDAGFAEGLTPMDLLLVSKRDALRSWSRSRGRATSAQASTFSFVEHIQFPYGSSSLPTDPTTLAPFSDLVEQLNQDPHLTVEVTGHTCAVSSAAFNQRLGQARAQALANWLMEQGIDAGRIAVRSAGEGQPLADNRTESGQAANRRVDVRIR